jgi:phosphoserine phosphatase RsbU/P
MATKILVVDDEEDIQFLMQQKFHKKIDSHEYEFTFASNGLEALEKLRKDPELAIILTDINMPEMDGLTLLSHLPELNRPYKAIVISAYEELSNIRSAMNKGAADFITKPIDFQDLEITLEKIILQCNASKECHIAQNRLNDIERELEIAKKIQEAMIPQKLTVEENTGSFDLQGIVLPARQIGGDFFDFFPLDQHRIGLIIADVSGKSISASLFMAITKTLFRSIARICSTTDEALNKVNALLTRDNPSCMFVTAFYAILDTSTGILNYSNAGHTSPFILSTSGNISQLDTNPAEPPLGIESRISESSFSQKSLVLKDRDCLFLYTDGITEAMNQQQEQFGKSRLIACLEDCTMHPLKEIIDRVLTNIQAFCCTREQSDDIAILCLRYYKKDCNHY